MNYRFTYNSNTHKSKQRHTVIHITWEINFNEQKRKKFKLKNKAAKLTVFLLCSAATAKPKAIRSKMKTVMSKSFEAIEAAALEYFHTEKRTHSTRSRSFTRSSYTSPEFLSLHIEAELSTEEARIHY